MTLAWSWNRFAPQMANTEESAILAPAPPPSTRAPAQFPTIKRTTSFPLAWHLRTLSRRSLLLTRSRRSLHIKLCVSLLATEMERRQRDLIWYQPFSRPLFWPLGSGFQLTFNPADARHLVFV